MGIEIENSTGSAVLTRCPLFLLSGDTVGELERLLQDLRGSRYTLLSLRDLFRCRHGMLRWPTRPCCVLLHGVSFPALREVLPFLAQMDMPVNLFCRVPYAPAEAEELRGCRCLHFCAEAEALEDGDSLLLPDEKDLHIAALCDTYDARTADTLRKARVWMALTVHGGSDAHSAPDGVPLLPVLCVQREERLPSLLARAHTMQLKRSSSPRSSPLTEQLPLALRTPFTALPLAARVSVLGADPARMERILAETDWNPAFNPSDGEYRLLPVWQELLEERLAPEDLSPEGFRRLLREGNYLFLQTCRFPFPRSRGKQLSGKQSGGLLLFGYDSERDVFLGMTALQAGTYERANFRSQTLRFYCADAGCKAFRWTVLERETTCSLDSVCEWAGMRSEPPDAEGVYHGWGASVAFANAVASEENAQDSLPVSVSSLCTFLEERMQNACRLRYFSRKEGLDTEAPDRYGALLDTEAKAVLQMLRSKLHSSEELDGISRLRLGTLFRRLLNEEELCRRAFPEDVERMRSLKAFLLEKNR